MWAFFTFLIQHTHAQNFYSSLFWQFLSVFSIKTRFLFSSNTCEYFLCFWSLTHLNITFLIRLSLADIFCVFYMDTSKNMTCKDKEASSDGQNPPDDQNSGTSSVGRNQHSGISSSGEIRRSDPNISTGSRTGKESSTPKMCDQNGEDATTSLGALSPAAADGSVATTNSGGTPPRSNQDNQDGSNQDEGNQDGGEQQGRGSVLNVPSTFPLHNDNGGISLFSPAYPSGLESPPNPSILVPPPHSTPEYAQSPHSRYNPRLRNVNNSPSSLSQLLRQQLDQNRITHAHHASCNGEPESPHTHSGPPRMGSQQQQRFAPPGRGNNVLVHNEAASKTSGDPERPVDEAPSMSAQGQATSFKQAPLWGTQYKQKYRQKKGKWQAEGTLNKKKRGDHGYGDGNDGNGGGGNGNGNCAHGDGTSSHADTPMTPPLHTGKRVDTLENTMTPAYHTNADSSTPPVFGVGKGKMGSVGAHVKRVGRVSEEVRKDEKSSSSYGGTGVLVESARTKGSIPMVDSSFPPPAVGGGGGATPARGGYGQKYNTCQGSGKKTEVLLKVGQKLDKKITTAMTRNIPNKYTPEELLGEFASKGFLGTFDFLYLPMDFNNRVNLGYCFINFESTEMLENFIAVFSGQQLRRYTTQKIIEVYSAKTQGFKSNCVKFLKGGCKRIQNPWFRPMVFHKVNGQCVCLPFKDSFVAQINDNLPEDRKIKL